MQFSHAAMQVLATAVMFVRAVYARLLCWGTPYLIGLLRNKIFAVLAISFSCINASSAPSKIVQLAVAEQRQHDLQQQHIPAQTVCKGSNLSTPPRPPHKGNRLDVRQRNAPVGISR